MDGPVLMQTSVKVSTSISTPVAMQISNSIRKIRNSSTQHVIRKSSRLLEKSPPNVTAQKTPTTCRTTNFSMKKLPRQVLHWLLLPCKILKLLQHNH